MINNSTCHLLVMERRQRTLYLTNASSQSFYQETNDCYDFTCRLAEPLILEPIGSWMCCLTQCVIPNLTKAPLYIICDVCDSTLLGEKKLPVLRVIHTTKSQFPDFSCAQYVSIREINQIRIRFQTADGKTPKPCNTLPGSELLPRKPQHSHCTVQFFRID